MTIRLKTLFAAVLSVLGLGLGLTAASMPAYALTMQECSAKYEAARKAGTLGEQKWNDFRKAQCGTDAKPAAAAKTDATKAAETAKPAAAAKTEVAKPVTATTGSAVFPKVVDPKYSKETAGKARMKTCVDQYNANKTANANGGLKWIQKGGGYYSECSKALKG